MNKSESKYFSTAARMDAAFLELIEKKDFAYITVKEICEKAGVNRSTFYLHYETVNDLLAESAQYIIDQFVEFMPHKTAEILDAIPTRPLDELYFITPEYLTPYLNYIKKYRHIFQVTIAQSSVLGMDKVYRKLNRHVLTPILNRFQVPSEKQKYIMAFHINGIMALIREWLNNDCKDSVEFIVSMIQICITSIRR